jgi:hypothetical protein
MPLGRQAKSPGGSRPSEPSCDIALSVACVGAAFVLDFRGWGCLAVGAHGSERTVQLLACAYPHPRSYTPAGSRRPLAKTRAVRTGWLVALADRGPRDGWRRHCAPQPA